MIKLNFYLKSDKSKEDLGYPIFLKLTSNVKSTTLSMNKWITKERWNATNKLKNSLRIDNRYIMARMNLALFYYQQGLVEKSEELYLKVIEQEPKFGNSYYMLGLLYNEIGNNKKAMNYLKLATETEPVNLNAFYNYALKLQQEGANLASIKIINKGLNIFSNNERLLYVKLIGEINLKQITNAKKTCNLLIEIAPDNQNYKQIFNSLLYNN